MEGARGVRGVCLKAQRAEGCILWAVRYSTISWARQCAFVEARKPCWSCAMSAWPSTRPRRPGFWSMSRTWFLCSWLRGWDFVLKRRGGRVASGSKLDTTVDSEQWCASSIEKTEDLHHPHCKRGVARGGRRG